MEQKPAKTAKEQLVDMYNDYKAKQDEIDRQRLLASEASLGDPFDSDNDETEEELRARLELENIQQQEREERKRQEKLQKDEERRRIMQQNLSYLRATPAEQAAIDEYNRRFNLDDPKQMEETLFEEFGGRGKQTRRRKRKVAYKRYSLRYKSKSKPKSRRRQPKSRRRQQR